MSAGKAFTNPSAAKIDQQRKILEELERQKKVLKTGAGVSLNVNQSQSIPTDSQATTSTITSTSGKFFYEYAKNWLINQ